MKRAAVFSGGGAAGISSVATATRLNHEYDMVAGTSTGALEAPLILLQKYDVLKEAYSNVANSNIYSHDPFNKNGKLNIWNALWRQITREPSFGESGELRKLIDKFVTEEDFMQLRAKGKTAIACVQETRHYPSTVYYKSSDGCSYANFKKWMWVSANAPMLMTQHKEGDFEYTDGGLSELLPIKPVIDSGYKDIDAFVHRTKKRSYDRGETKDSVHAILRYFAIMREEIERKNIEYGIQKAKELGINLTVYWLPEEVTGDFMFFDKDKMQKWYDVSYESAFDESRIDRYNFK